MCGFVGVVHSPNSAAAGNPVKAGDLRRMMSAIAHRGPDSNGVWTKGPVGLGHVRLSILDLSANGHQPFVTEDERGVLVYNGEVYNFRELRRELESEGIRFRSTGDTEVVLRAVHHWGPQVAVPKFNGMFAFAYLDRRTDELWLARDRLGIKPLYWSNSGGVFVFGSEIKALLQHPNVPCRPDMHALTAYLLTASVEGDWTTFEEIRSLRAGTLARFSGTQFTEFIYYDLLDSLDPERLAAGSAIRGEQWVERFGATFEQSVEMHLLSDAPVAAMCSGGVDSSLIAACAHEHRPDLTGYVADVKGAVSEGAIARRMADHLGVRLRQIDVDHEEYLRLWPQTVWHSDQPNFFCQDPAFLAVAQACSAEGFKVLLTGEGADELFGGYPWQTETWAMYRRRKWIDRLLPSFGPLARWKRGLGKLLLASHSTTSRMPLNTDQDVLSGLSHSRHHVASPYLRTLAPFADQRCLRRERIFERLDFVQPIEERAFLARSIDDTYGHLQLLLHRNDRLGMAASIESRFPFLNNDLLDFALHLPFHAKRHRAQGKWAVKQFAARKLLPELVFAKKIGFAITSSMWMTGMPLLRDGFLADTLKWSARSRETILERVAESKWLCYLVLSAELWGRIYFAHISPEELAQQLLRLRPVDVPVKC